MKHTWKLVRIGAFGTAMALGSQLFGSLVLSPGATAYTGTVATTTRVHARTAPSTKSESLTVLASGQRLSAHGSSKGWTKVTWNGRSAYVYSKYLTSARDSSPISSGGATGSAITTANLNVRTGPSIRYRVVETLKKGTSVTLLGNVSGEYSQINWRGNRYWVATAYLSDSPGKTTPGTAGKVQTTDNLHARAGSSTAHRSYGVMPRGTIVGTTGRTENGFTEIIWRGHARWAYSSYLRAVGNNTPAPVAPALPKTTRRWATANLNIWLANTGQQHKGEIPRGSALAATGKVQNGRAEIVHNGALRWVTARYTSSTDPNPGAGSSTAGGKWDLTSAPITDGPRGAALNRGYSKGMERTNPYIQRIAADVFHRFPEIKTLYGWRRDVTPDHPAGRAVDVMIPDYRNNKKLGWAIANYYRKYHKELNIKYIIWEQQIWNVSRDREGWRPMKSRGNDTANHLDHVHINSN